MQALLSLMQHSHPVTGALIEVWVQCQGRIGSRESPQEG